MTTHAQEPDNSNYNRSTPGGWLAIDPLPTCFGRRLCLGCEERAATLWVRCAETGPLFLCEPCADGMEEESVTEFGMPPSLELRAATLAFVRERGEVTFVQLAVFLMKRDVPVDGDYAITAPDDPSLMFWIGMSAEMLGLVFDLVNAGELVIRPTSVETYSRDGILLNLPLAWPSPHCRPEGAAETWSPVVLAQPRPRRRRRRPHAASK